MNQIQSSRTELFFSSSKKILNDPNSPQAILEHQDIESREEIGIISHSKSHLSSQRSSKMSENHRNILQKALQMHQQQNP